ncbi:MULTISPECIES: bifunctional aspartate kinase/homoserine dehydrogenase I [unclassified Anaerobiospirillum]|uniref:bifunctional aspartate kinase/homoserine dehydrogenase I n=1 Tax=unclassified Anaerobiospirillum TaxID=2647410 RepID=UPI001FF1F72C|nr:MULTISPECIES: bifunctional aspartate kinase/homoserine dehydrogenase I [unclassified Anaerobiospirillum]MCK0535650.1 bifunctional aspartate kinase/homoserine dehydrogenase I [Anaerobiospirillum sp. NML120511]MCK0540802.1 bifunctional aspartate kinase/homoserine dehydrogenase I [Anaerobiospirillum sp. NML02-A-032]
MRVLKFGGTSVADAQRVVNVSEIAINTAMQVQTALVLSAPAGVTNILVSMVKSALAGSDCKNEFSALDQIVRPLINNLASQYPRFDGELVMAFYEETVSELRRRVSGITLLGSCPDPVAAFIECRGEAISIAVMSELLRAREHEVQVIDPVDILVCDGKYLESSVDIEASIERFKRIKINENAIVLMSGFCGGNRQGELVLLGRNGSDYSAACLAAVAHAQCCEIWTDVDGVYSCDPRAVPDAVLLRRMSYKEAMELSYFGAKVLHPRTISPIAQYRIPCLIKNTLNPQGEGTLISEESDRNMITKGISDLKNVSMINVSGPGMKGMVGMAGRLFTCISRANVSIVLITQSSSEYSITFCVHTEDAFAARAAIEEEFKLELNAHLLDPVEIQDRKAIISVVGEGMRTAKGVSSKFFRALAQANINVNAIAQGSSERSISAVIDANKVSEAVFSCHTAFFSGRQIIDLIIVGVGGVGAALLRQIEKQRDELQKRNGIEIRVICVANSHTFIKDPRGLKPEAVTDLLKNSQNGKFTIDEAKRLVDDSHLVNPVFVDCTSSDDIALTYLELMQAGYHVVTPNKKANTSTLEYYTGLRDIARICHRKFYYEATVGAGLPVINTLQNLLAAGDRLIEFNGIMSGTLSYIFGLVDEGKSLSEATRDAYERGFSEPNPRDDLEGMDVARKLLILARECGYRLNLDDIQVECPVDAKYLQGESAQEVLENLKGADEEFACRAAAARAEGKVLRYVATIEDGGKCSCGIKAVGPEDPLFKVTGGENALSFTSAYYQPIPLVIRGYGAGTDVTAAGVFSDILRLQNWTREA